MRSRLLTGIMLISLAGCQASDSTTPNDSPDIAPRRVISDATHASGNPDFFFLPPMAENPKGSATYDAGAFNADLQPSINICALNATIETGVNINTACQTGGYILNAIADSPSGEAYHYNWKIPSLAAGKVFYRVAVTVGTTQLGVADVEAVAEGSDLKHVNDALFVAAKAGSTLPVKFRIEKFALCPTPGTGPCASKTISLSEGGDVTLTLEGQPAGVHIPPQSGSGLQTVTASTCSDMNSRVIDLPTFGPCVTITASPGLPLTGLATPATVFICSVPADVPTSISHAQSERITLHRYDAPNTVASLPHAAACGTELAATGSITKFFASLVRGSLKSAGRELAVMMAPKPLYAMRRIDQGAGGETSGFSDFQFALPAKLEITAGNSQTGAPGSTLPILPTVTVKDLAGDAVLGARVRFAPNSAACAALAAGVGTLSNTSGVVTGAAWTLPLVEGSVTQVACGRGLAGTDVNGPRGTDVVVDPFQPLSVVFGDPINGQPVPVLTGSVQFTATVLPTTPIAFGSGGYSSYGPFTGAVTPPVGWPLPLPATSTTIGSVSPFLGSYGSCAITSGFAGAATFPANSDIFLTKSFSAPSAGSLEIVVRIDNDLRIWVDGVEKTSAVPASGSGAYNVGTGWWVHDNCADVGPAVLMLPVTGGSHTISLQGHDRGAVGYLDMKLTLTPNP
ncbi:MAG: hypothetical protein ABI120_04740 [Gemmatimonadaceae bacterium]